ncbi:MAG: hypothetical protein A4E45_02115 [Methanosaeta sp. PtaB.Bin039]|nr:MAG: hypothetical protein A4E45_02115 [Methanosaeta sp. PtaB.Bin039]
MIEHQPGTLLVVVVEGHRSVAGIRHARDIFDADTLWIGCRLSCRGDPLMGSPVAYPRDVSAMQVKRCPVLGVHSHDVSDSCGIASRIHLELDLELHLVSGDRRHPELAVIGRRLKAVKQDLLAHLEAMGHRGRDLHRVSGHMHRHHWHGHIRTGSRAHHRAVNRYEEVSTRIDRKLVGELDAHRRVPLGQDHWAQVGYWGDVSTVLDLHISPQLCWGKVCVHLLGVLPQLDLVIVATSIRSCVRNAYCEKWQWIDEFPDSAAERPRT